MDKQLNEELGAFRNELYTLFRRYLSCGEGFLLRTGLTEELDRLLEGETNSAFRESQVVKWLRTAQEAAVFAPNLFLSLRPGMGRWQYLHIDTEQMSGRFITVSEFLSQKERLVEKPRSEGWALELDLGPFERGFPRMKESRSIGRGVEFLNRHLSNRLFASNGQGAERLLEFMKVHHHGGVQLMLSPSIVTLDDLQDALRETVDYLESLPPDKEWIEFLDAMPRQGFEPGWGRTAEQVRETMSLLLDILEAPDPKALQEFLVRIPMVFTIAILSPHGYFGQSRVLGKPDTGGQVVYILDQVRALERQMIEDLHNQGLEIEPTILVLTRLIPDCGDTTCDQPVEPISGARHARILRIPFKNEKGETIEEWISRFDIWPHLEQYALDAEKELLSELGRRPDLILGNYSDGNLVATLLSQRMQVTQCTIAHALEKTKYLHSDLYWKENEAEHHFSCQFTADLIAMNTSDFIIASTLQEIAGTKDSVGQYESYRSFTMPDLYRVINGVDVYDPKFNIVSPGADPDIFFPYSDEARRNAEIRERVRELVHGGESDEARGVLGDKDKPVLFVMSRLDRIKNTTGMLEWYAKSDRLREVANLCIAGGFIDPARSSDSEEQDLIRKTHALMDEYKLDDQVRWLEMQTEKAQVGALYRYIADCRGAFVQPALFEAFGLTVVEAMSSGLPTFATCYGGPLEIIEDGVSGFHIDPNHGDAAADRMAEFFERCAGDPGAWATISDGAIERIRTRYTWELYAKRLLSLTRIYGFWKYISNIEREETGRYLEMFYGLMYRPMAERINTTKY